MGFAGQLRGIRQLQMLIIIALVLFISLEINLSSAENEDKPVLFTDQNIEKYKSMDSPEEKSDNHTDTQPDEQPVVRRMMPAAGIPNEMSGKPQSAVGKSFLKNPIVPLVKVSVIDVSEELRRKSPRRTSKYHF
jgi:hypothetical protein